MISALPKYFLYGELDQEVETRFLHVESIAERSRAHRWIIRPHSHRELAHFLLVLKGAGAVDSDSARISFTSPAYLQVPAAAAHGFEFQPGTDGWIITVSGALLLRLENEYPELATSIPAFNVFNLRQQTASVMTDQFNQLAEEFKGNAPGRRPLIEAALIALLVQSRRMLLRHHGLVESVPQGLTSDAGIVQRYRDLIERSYSQDVTIAGMANHLNVSHERLRQACVRLCGCAPHGLLVRRRILEAKRCLLYTKMSIAEIAEAVGFHEAAYLSRVFTRQCGLPPRAFRSQKTRLKEI